MLETQSVSPVSGNLVNPRRRRVFDKALRLVNEPWQVFSDYSAGAGSVHRHVPSDNESCTRIAPQRKQILVGTVDADRRNLDRGNFGGSDSTRDCHAMRKSLHSPTVFFPPDPEENVIMTTTGFAAPWAVGHVPTQYTIFARHKSQSPLPHAI